VAAFEDTISKKNQEIANAEEKMRDSERDSWNAIAEAEAEIEKLRLKLE
jgi:hypothetical protein